MPDGRRISVVIPVFNRVSLVQEAVDSVRGQTVDCWELVVVDDGSTEDVRGALAPAFADPRIIYRRQEHAGRSVARNQGAAAAKGELLCFLDSDDRYVANALEAFLDAFSRDDEIGLALGGYDYVDPEGRVVGTRRPWEERACDLEGWFFQNFGLPASTMVARTWFDRVGGFDPGLDGVEDRHLFLQLALSGCPMGWVRQSVCHYRLHAGNTDSRAQRDAGLRMFERVLRDPRCPPSIAGRANEVLTGPYLLSARRAAASGDDALVRENLERAAALVDDRAWRRDGMLLSPSGFPVRLQWLAADVAKRCGEEPAAVDAELSRLAEAWDRPHRELHRALAQRHARAFLGCLGGRDLDAAAAERRRALQLDRRWYAHRSFLLFPLRRLAAAAKTSP